MRFQPETLHQLAFAVDLFTRYSSLAGGLGWKQLTQPEKMAHVEDLLRAHYQIGQQPETYEARLASRGVAPPIGQKTGHEPSPQQLVGCGAWEPMGR